MFSRAVKYLDILKSRKATSDDSNIRSTKQFSILKSRAIKKIPTVLYLNPFSYTETLLQPNTVPRGATSLLFQWNVSLEKDFHITKVEVYSGGVWNRIAFPHNEYGSVEGGNLFVKFREDTDVTRMTLIGTGFMGSFISDTKKPYQTAYTGQQIKKNFCIEFWRSQAPFVDKGLVLPLRLTTTIVSNPSTADSIETAITLDDPLVIDPDLGFALPAALPITQNNLVYSNNI